MFPTTFSARQRSTVTLEERANHKENLSIHFGFRKSLELYEFEHL